MRILVTGATGYVGGHLVPALLERGHHVRVLTRSPAGIATRPWADDVEVAEGDATDRGAVRRALEGIDVAYFLLHSMDGGGDFQARDRALAHTFADAATDAGVGRLVYLGGLHPEGELSPHLASRVEVGEILLASPVPTAVLQAGVVLGDGSASYDMLRHLTERLPAMVAPRWLVNRIQPVAVRDIVHYLAEAATLPGDVNRTFDVGMPEVLTYADMMRRYAARAGLPPRLIVTLPVLTPGLASHWVGLVTPVDAGVARPLVGSLVHDAVCHEHDLEALVPPPPGGLLGYEEALDEAMRSYDPRAWRRSLAGTSAAVAVTAAAGALLTDPRSRWYDDLDKPAWQPPPAAFPVVWSALYAAIAASTAATRVELEPGERRAFDRALGLNLALNAGWSGMFFRARRPDVATVVAGALAASSADLARRAAPTGRGKAAALAAYAGWCAFATGLSGTIARRNRPGRP